MPDTGPGGLIAVDLGGSAVTVLAAGPDGRDQESAYWSGDVAADLTAVGRLVERARARLPRPVRHVGVAAAPAVGPDGTVLAWPSRPDWTGVPVVPVIAGAAGAPVSVADDGSLAAVAEAHLAGCPDLAFLGLGTGLGGGVVTGGRLLRGAAGSAGQTGHVVVDPGGPRCRCGRRGCLQARVSGGALADRAGRLRGRPTSTRELVTGAAAGRRWAERTLEVAAVDLARAVVVLAELVQPARVHLGGGLGTALTDLPERVTRAVAALARPGQPLPVVAPAGYGAAASLAGALLLAARPDLAGAQEAGPIGAVGGWEAAGPLAGADPIRPWPAASRSSPKKSR